MLVVYRRFVKPIERIDDRRLAQFNAVEEVNAATFFR